MLAVESLETRLEEQALDKRAIELFTKHESHFTPTHPWVLVRVLPREQYYKGLIILPDGKQQNKPVHEAIVLATWKPFTHRWRQRANNSFGDWDDCEKEIKSDFEIGDHVTYHWSSGMDAAGWDERFYRLVPEHVRSHRGIDSNGIIFGKLNYPRESVETRITKIVEEGLKAKNQAGAIADLLRKDFDVIYKEKFSRTTSGASKSNLS